MRTAKAAPGKTECLNPNTGRSMQIDSAVYALFVKAILQVLKKEGAITFTQLQEGVSSYLATHQHTFTGAVGWYTVTVKHDLHARGRIEVFTEKGKKLHRLKN